MTVNERFVVPFSLGKYRPDTSGVRCRETPRPDQHIVSKWKDRAHVSNILITEKEQFTNRLC